jgi:hypothetical protein
MSADKYARCTRQGFFTLCQRGSFLLQTKELVPRDRKGVPLFLGHPNEGSSPKSLALLCSAQEKLAVLGVGVVVLGALLEVAAVIRFFHYKASISKGTFTSAVLVYLLGALGLVLLSVAYIIYVVVG